MTTTEPASEQPETPNPLEALADAVGDMPLAIALYVSARGSQADLSQFDTLECLEAYDIACEKCCDDAVFGAILDIVIKKLEGTSFKELQHLCDNLNEGKARTPVLQKLRQVAETREEVEYLAHQLDGAPDQKSVLLRLIKLTDDPTDLVELLERERIAACGLKPAVFKKLQTATASLLPPEPAPDAPPEEPPSLDSETLGVTS